MRVNNKEHWEKVYSRNTDQDVGWYQEKPNTSINLIKKYSDSNAVLIDIGSGNSNLGNELIQRGYSDLTLVDISSHAIERSKSKISEGAEKINFIESSVLELNIDNKFDLWHDRAVFHFLWDDAEINTYAKKVVANLKDEGIFILGVFSLQGPEKCSALLVNRQSIESIKNTFGAYFELIESFTEDHTTPMDKTQNYLFAVLKKK